MNPTLLTIPTDCLISIVNFVDRSNISKLERTCKTLKDASRRRTLLISDKPTSFADLERYPNLLAYDGYVNIDYRGKLPDSLTKQTIRSKTDIFWLLDFMKNHPQTPIDALIYWADAPTQIFVKLDFIRMETNAAFPLRLVRMLRTYRINAIFSVSSSLQCDDPDFMIPSYVHCVETQVYSPIESKYIIESAAKAGVKTLLIHYKGLRDDIKIIQQLKVPKDLQITWSFPVTPKYVDFDSD